MKANFFVFMSNYWGGDTPSGKLSCMASPEDQEKRDGKVGLEPVIMSCSPQLAQSVNQLNCVPCMMELDFSIKNTSNGTTFFVTSAVPYEQTMHAFDDFINAMFQIANQSTPTRLMTSSPPSPPPAAPVEKPAASSSVTPPPPPNAKTSVSPAILASGKDS